ncbi:heavy-metal-associated domain-containing protein [Neobacillus niacini]|uniref:heavy-metal-associated domain-containing protein n=1 Tax=Neobacillus niacini TaxID=86668 RepID=UPI002FFF23AE
MSMILLSLNEVACSGCIGSIKRKVKRFRGVEKVKILSGTGKIEINYDAGIIQSEELNRSIHKLARRTFD